MKPNFDYLIEIMDEEISCYERMQAILSEEKQAVMHRQRDDFHRIIQEKQSLVEEIKQIEERRRHRVDKMAQELRLADDALPLKASQLAGHLAPPMAGQLVERATVLKRLMTHVKMENNANARLFSHYLELVHGALKMLNGLVYGHSVYAKPGTGSRVTGYGGNCGKVFCGNI